ncbi:diphthine--ammonia ligase-like [Argonauta hians]
MKVVGLVSGGKDSTFNMMQCVAEGHEIVALANLKPLHVDEMDSYMFQTVGHHAIDLYAEAMEVPLFRKTIQGHSKKTERDYDLTEGDEVEDLYDLLKLVMEQVEDINAVSVGAILSDYQRVRVENVCSRLGLTVLAYLWRRDQQELLTEMIEANVHAIIIKVAAMGLLPEKHLGLTLKEIFPAMFHLHQKYGLNICGEGGEYETFTLDCPLFKKKIVIDDSNIVCHSDDAFAPVGYIHFNCLHLEEKTDWNPLVLDLPMKRSKMLMEELFSAEEQTSSQFDNLAEKYAMENPASVEIKPPLIKLSSEYFWIANLVGHGINVQEASQLVMDTLNKSLSQCKDFPGLKNIYSVHLYVKSMEDYSAINDVYKRYFGTNPPVRVCVEIDLPSNIFLKMHVAGSYKVQHPDRHTMHVQSFSHWAPANIGPYSQAVKINMHLFLAGIIGLCPATMELPESCDIKAEARLSLRHVHRILEAMHTECTFQHIALCICYITDKTLYQLAKNEWDRMVTINNDDDDDTCSQLRPIILFAVVSALPKKAHIEWDCRAIVTEQSDIEKEIHTISSGHVHIEYRIYEGNKISGFKGSIYLNDSLSANSIPSIGTLLRELFEIINTIINEVDTTWSDISIMKIFYLKDWLDYSELESNLQSAFENIGIPLYSLVPVRYLMEESCILSVCL